MPTWQSGDIIANGIRIHYTRTGGEKPALVLAHGVTDDGLCWTPVAQALEADYDVIMVDARGHGRSEAPESNYKPTDHAADLHGVITGLGLQRPIVMGHSMGAVTTLTLAGMYPETPAAIILEDPPGFWTPPSDPVLAAEGMQRMQSWMTAIKTKTREEMIAEQRVQAPHWSEAEIGPWADSKLRFSLNVVSGIGTNRGAGMDWPAMFARIGCPVLLITADPEHGAALGTDAEAMLQRLIPQLRVANVPGAGHNIRRDQFDAFMAAVRGFLKN